VVEAGAVDVVVGADVAANRVVLALIFTASGYVNTKHLCCSKYLSVKLGTLRECYCFYLTVFALWRLIAGYEFVYRLPFPNLTRRSK
jgi:hypothetical protein